MAGDWIKMRTNLNTDPAVVRIATGLSLDRFSVVGRLHAIWAWANEHLTDGQDVPVDAAFLDSLIATPGFAAEMRRVGWLSGRDGSLGFPQFDRHNGSTAKSRAMDAVRKQRAREQSDNCPDANRTESGPEKRREEKNKSSNKTQGTLSRFVAPTIEDVAAYCRERGNSVSPQAFVDHYAANGWMRGKNKIKDWKACVRTWEQNQHERKSSATGNTAAAREQRTADAFAVVLGQSSSAGDPKALQHEAGGGIHSAPGRDVDGCPRLL